MLCRLGGSAPGNKNGIIFPVRFVRPKKVMISAAFSRVLPHAAILIQALDRRRIGIVVVEVLNLCCYIK